MITTESYVQEKTHTKAIQLASQKDKRPYNIVMYNTHQSTCMGWCGM